MAIFETAARKLLHGAAVARGVGAGTFSFGLGSLWQLIAGFFAHLWQLISGFFAGIFVHLWQLISGIFAGTLVHLWQLISGIFTGILAALAGAAHEVALQLEAFWQWLQAAAAVALPYVLVVAAVLMLLVLVWCCGPALCAAAVGLCKALVVAVCYLGRGLYFVGAAVARALSCLLPPCAQCLGCCAVVTMKAPGAAGMLISRAAFVAAPALYFQILHAGGAVVAADVFCARPVAEAVAAPVAALFRLSVGA